MNIGTITRKNKKYLLIAFGLLLCSAIYYFGVYNAVTTVDIQSKYVSYDDVNELEKSADLIIIGNSKKDFVDSDHYATYFSDGTLEDFYSIVNVKVDKIFKGPENITKGGTIDIIEPASIIQTIEGKQLLKIEDYTPLEKNNKYILFLKKNDNGQYCIINMNLGKIDMAFKEKQLDETKITGKFMKDVFDKYQTE